MSSGIGVEDRSRGGGGGGGGAVRALCWDPRSPSSLLLPTMKDGTPHMDELVSDIGTGCNKHELTALKKILVAHEEYEDMRACPDKTNRSLGSAGDPSSAAKYFLRECRAAVRDCLERWDNELNEEEEEVETKNGEGECEGIAAGAKSGGSLDLLRATFSVMHLTDVFLPLISSEHTMDFHQDPFDKPGVITADTVRYLRYNHVCNAMDVDPAVGEMMQSSQPEQFGDGQLYWKYIRTLVLRGRLHEAWEALSRHSLFQQSMQTSMDYTNDRYYSTTMNEIKTGFMVVKKLMFTAPLPAGRTKKYDDALGTPQWDDDRNETGPLEPRDPGVSYSDYKYWEHGSSLLHGSGESAVVDYPPVFSPESAMRKHREWRDFIAERRQSLLVSRRVPELDSVIAIMSGDFAGVEFESWSERLCAELLYVRPDIRPRHLGSRARRIISDMEESRGDGADMYVETQALLSVMDGDAGRAIEFMYYYGGASGAALPSTLTSLLYNMFIASGILSPEFSFRKNEFLCETSSAIISSLSRSNPDVGAHLAVRLLMPYALQEGTPEIVAAIAEILEHHAPETDAGAKALLDLCRPLVDRNSLQVLGGCICIVLYRFRRYREEMRPGGAMHWLVVGIELESVLLDPPELGYCFKTLVATCHGVSRSLLDVLSGDVEEIDGSVDSTAKEMATSLKKQAFDTQNIPEVRQFTNVLRLFDAMLEDESPHEKARCVVACLDPRSTSCNDAEPKEVVVTLLWPLLKVARTILSADEAERRGSGFDKRGIWVLMEALTRISSLSSEGPNLYPPEDEIFEMKGMVARAMATPYVAERTRTTAHRTLQPRHHEAVRKLRSVDILNSKPSVRKAIVQKMLDI